ncbi:hypothetical protein POM88_025272 [Heracleum sosnowskyi]|uniref:Neutral/alkaline non-lysosomal ceramidase N-terminal domain-containing protein n=1 Tax=Heracleum sosnowskyi TaxID=360622 RepID=A0AAD8MNP1_9APIA|nr:hypothetical protein POM88_025272 [Heracleum sosnowskyi]
MAQEEFQESDIIFQDNFGCSDENANASWCITDYSDYRESRSNDHFKRKKKSVPINIPETHSDNKFGYVYDDYDRKIMPPHVILGQRFVGKMAFSVCSEDGRNLKGRQFTTLAGRRLRDAVKTVLTSGGNKEFNSNVHIVIAGLTNTYSQYVTTFEEYKIQRYEVS